jgi:hypothetical protein
MTRDELISILVSLPINEILVHDTTGLKDIAGILNNNGTAVIQLMDIQSG